MGNARNGLIHGSEGMRRSDRVQLALWREDERRALLFRPL